MSEGTGAAALRFGRDRRDVNLLAGGVRIGGAMPLGDSLSLEPKVAVSYEHGWGDLGDTRSASFAGTGPTFGVGGVRIGRNSVDADAGIDLVTKSGFRIGGAGFVSQSKQWRDYGAKVSVGFRF